jgi:hypothetical protein
MMRPLLPPILGLVLGLTASLSAAPDRLIADTLRFGDADAERALQTRGDVRAETLETEIGGFQRRYPVQTVGGTGSELRFTLRRTTTGKPAVLEIQEIHSRRPQAFGYTISVNGTELYFRTYEEIGAGPNHLFVWIPAEIAGASTELTVTLTNAGAPAFSIGQAWLYDDFFGTVDTQEQVYRPMALLGMHFKKPAPGEPALRSFGPLGDYASAHYANQSTAKTRTHLLGSINRAAQTSQPVQFLINGATWGGAPSGPDGLGGYFNDVRYSLLSYDANRGQFSPSFPNMWNSTFWATFRDPHMNAVLRERFLNATRGASDQIDFLRAHGQDPRVIVLREMGPPMGEVTAATIAAAQRDGVILDPKDGLDESERLWLFRDSVRLWNEYASWHAAAIERAAVVVDRGQVRLPEYQVSENQYAHTIFKTPGPMKDRRWFGGQAGIVDGFWTSGELFWDKFGMYDYVKANGKLAHGNLEATILKNDAAPLRLLYASGFQFVNFLNETADILTHVRKVDGCDDAPALPVPHHEPTLLEVQYHLQQTLGSPDNLVGSQNLRISKQVRETADAPSVSRLSVGDTAAPGSVTYRLTNGGEPFVSGLTLTLDGRVSPGGNRIEVWAGGTPETLQRIASLNENQLPCPDHWTPYMTSKTKVDLGQAMIGQREFLLRLTLHSPSAPDAAFLMESHVGTQWKRASGYLVEAPLTMRQQRTLQLWVQDRVAAQRLLQHYRTLAGMDPVTAQAELLLDQGRYRSAERLLTGEISHALPARFVIRGHGPLGRYPLQVRLDNDADVLLVTLHAVTPTAVEFSAVAESGQQNVLLSLAHPPGSEAWVLKQVGPQRYRLEAGLDGLKQAVADGRVLVRLQAAPLLNPSPARPSSLVARYLDGNKRSLRVDTQDLALMGGEESLTLTVTKEVRTTRAAERLPVAEEGKPWPRALDRVELDLNAQGEVIAIRSLYGHDRGRIKQITAPSVMGPFNNGSLELENGQIYEFSYATQLETVAMRGRYCAYENHMVAAGLQPGQEVVLDYSPYAENGTRRRLIRVSQPHRVLFKEDYQAATDDRTWRQRAVQVDGLKVGPHKPEPNYLHNVVMPLLRPTQAFTPESVIYLIESDRPLKMTVAEFTARAFEDSSRVEFFVSDDQKTWVKCGQFDNRWQNAYPQSIDSKAWRNPPQFVDLSAGVAGKTRFFLKMTLHVNAADERYCVGSLRVITEGSSP